MSQADGPVCSQCADKEETHQYTDDIDMYTDENTLLSVRRTVMVLHYKSYKELKVFRSRRA